VFFEDYKEKDKKLRNRWSIINFRSPLAKYWNAHAMFLYEGYEPVRPVYNTGVVGASKRTMAQLDYFDDFDYTMEIMEDIQQNDELYVDNIREAFGYDNETVFSFKVHTNNVKCELIDSTVKKWHGKVTYDDVKKKENMPDAFFLHFINKKLEWFFDD
jgi:hypothetical protein